MTAAAPRNAALGAPVHGIPARRATIDPRPRPAEAIADRHNLGLFASGDCENFHKLAIDTSAARRRARARDDEHGHVSAGSERGGEGQHPRAAAAAGALSRPVGRGHGAADRRGAGGAGRPARHPRPSLPARRGDPVRRLHRRLVQAVARDRQAPASRVHRVLRRALHGRERRRARPAAPEGDPARPGRGLLDGRHGPGRRARDLLERAGTAGHGVAHRPGHLHQLRRGGEELRRRARRHGVHVVERRRRAGVGLGAEGEDPVPARPAPGPQHRLLPHGRAARPDGGVGSQAAVRRVDPRAGRRGAADPVEGPLLGARALHGAADCRSARRTSRRARDRAPGSAVRGGGGRRRQRLDRVHPRAGAGRRARLGLGGRVPRSTWCTASPPRWRRRA